MRETEGNYEPWGHPEVFQTFEKRRALTHNAARNAVENILVKFAPKEAITVELGGGIGELQTLLPDDYKKNLISLDNSVQYNRLHRERFPDSTVVSGDIENLPLQSRSIDLALSYSAFDTLKKLNKAGSEVNRVLKENGKFIHFLDLQPDYRPLFDSYPKSTIPFPQMEATGNAITNFQLLKRESLNDLLAAHPQLAPIYRQFGEDPFKTFKQLYLTSTPLLKEVSDSIETSGIKIKRTDSPEKLFEKRLISALLENHLWISYVGPTVGEAIVPRAEAHSKFPESNVFFSDLGKLSHGFNQQVQEEAPPDHVKEISRLHVAVAEKFYYQGILI